MEESAPTSRVGFSDFSIPGRIAIWRWAPTKTTRAEPSTATSAVGHEKVYFSATSCLFASSGMTI
jgi:hypothetical protein